MRPPAKKGTGKSPYLNKSPSLDEVSESYGVVAGLFFGCSLYTWSPSLHFARGDTQDASEEDEEEKGGGGGAGGVGK